MCNLPPATTLDRLRAGDVAQVFEVFPAQGENFEASRRLKELGFIQGEKIKVLHRGYFGGEPIAVRVGHSTFALRRFEAALIGVTAIGVTVGNIE